MSKIYNSKVSEILENGDAVIDLPDELIEDLEWKIGDELHYSMKNNSIIITNLSKGKRNGFETKT